MDGRKRSARRAILASLLAVAMSALVVPGVAFAADEPNGSASCMGLEQASISPPGSSVEEPGGASQLIGEVKELASFFGVKPGALLSFIASLHAGSHAQCDEALEG
jgi:hypothetical protein